MGLSPIDIARNALRYRVKSTVNHSRLTPAAILLLLYPKDGEFCVLLNKRSDLVENHKGEISFPGGVQDPGDADLLDTALREAEEEMGIQRSDVTILGELDQVETRSSYQVQPFVGTIGSQYQFCPSDIEIAEVLEVPVPALLDPANLRVETRWQDGVGETSFSYAHNEHLIFGATARILHQFLDLVKDSQGKEVN
jgi:8-oxo-dGTP pyrophosphatase MutT (NUDIX family)